MAATSAPAGTTPVPISSTPEVPAVPSPPPVQSAPAAPPASAAPVAPPAETPPAPAQPASLVTLTPDEVAAGIALRDENVVIPAAGYRAFLRTAAESARTEARRDLEASIQARVSKLGFADLSDLLTQYEAELNNPPQETPPMATTAPPAAAPAATPAPATAPTAPAAPAPAATPPIGAHPTPPAAATPPGQQPAVDDPVNDRRIPDATRRRLNKLRDDMRARADAAEQQATQHQQQVTTLQGQLRAAQEAEKLKIAMVRAGVQEVDFAWHLLSAELSAMRDSQDPAVKEQLAKFDVATWAATLKTTRPYLFGQQPVPATSPAQPHAPAPAAQTPGAVTGQAAAAGAVDLRKATPEQMRQRMSELGINYNRRGRPG
jgi:hypothetical protein